MQIKSSWETFYNNFNKQRREKLKYLHTENLFREVTRKFTPKFFVVSL